MTEPRREGFLLGLSALAALLAGSSSCGHTSAAVPAPAASTPQSEKTVPGPVAAHVTRSQRVPMKVSQPPEIDRIDAVMADHFSITNWARDAVIAGMLEPMRGPLNALAERRYEEIPDAGWAPQLAQLQAAARLTSSAATLDAAAMGVAAMGRICGECHAQRHSMPVIPHAPESSPQAGPESVPERMDRHRWATELLWSGLTGPSDLFWRMGADMLMLAPKQLDRELPAAFDADLQEIRSFAQQARGAVTLAERADLVGSLIATCADCHARWIEDEKLGD